MRFRDLSSSEVLSSYMIGRAFSMCFPREGASFFFFLCSLHYGTGYLCISLLFNNLHGVCKNQKCWLGLDWSISYFGKGTFYTDFSLKASELIGFGVNLRLAFLVLAALPGDGYCKVIFLLLVSLRLFVLPGIRNYAWMFARCVMQKSSPPPPCVLFSPRACSVSQVELVSRCLTISPLYDSFGFCHASVFCGVLP